jgi:hypothetical protein
MDTEAHNSRMRETLEAEFGWKIEGPFYTSVPMPRSELVVQRSVQESVQGLQNYLLSTVMIDDGFGANHTVRRAFESDYPEVSAFNSEFCKLGGNNLLKCSLWMEDIVEANKKQNPKICEDLNQVAQFSSLSSALRGYNEMSFDEKVKFARALDETIFRFLSVLAK